MASLDCPEWTPRLDWNSHLNGSGTPCANKNFVMTGGDFYIVQLLDVWNFSTNVWDVCNFGPKVWNPGPGSHAVTTGYSWVTPPCFDHAIYSDGSDVVLYKQQSSIADQFGFGYGIWQYSSTYIEVYTCPNGEQYC